MTEISEFLDDLERAHAAATPGPWRQDDEFPQWFGTGESTYIGTAPSGDDAALIVAAVNHLPALLAAVRAGLAEHQPAGPCSCEGRRWTKDENWSPEDLRAWRGERREGIGLIPCGFCNHGGWNTEQYEPVDPFCEVCDLPWPCPTVTAITAALSPESVTS